MIYYGYIDDFNNWRIFDSKDNLKNDLKKIYGRNFNFEKFLFEYEGILFKTDKNEFNFYGLKDILNEKNYLIRKIYKELSRNFSPEAKNIILVKFQNNFKTKSKNRLSYDELKEKNLKPLEIYEKIDPADFKLAYGGFITEKKEIIKIKEFSHLEILDDYYDIKSYDEAYKKGFVRFITRLYPKEFNISGKKQNLLKTFEKWSDFALQNELIIVDIILNDKSASIIIKNKNLSKRDLYNMIKNASYNNVSLKENLKKANNLNGLKKVKETLTKYNT